MPYGYKPLEAGVDPSLREALDQYFAARLSGDVDALIELTLSLSFEHQDVEAALHRRSVELLSLHGHRNCAVAVDESNPFHVWVFTPIVATINATGECQASAFVTQWILLEGKWYTFPEGAPILSGAKKNHRPNSITRVPLSGEESEELQRIIDGLVREEPPN